MATLFNDKIFGQTAFQALRDLLTPVDLFSTNISSELKSEGDSVTVPLFGAITTTTFTQSTTVMEQSGGLISAITVSLNKRKITPMDLTHQQLAESSNAGRFDQYAFQLGKSMAETVLSDIWSLIGPTNFGAAVITTASANYSRVQMIKARQALLQAGVRGPKSSVINTDVEAALLDDDKLTLALNRGDAMAIKEGELGRLLGIDWYSSDVLGYNSTSLVGFVCGKEAIAFASRNLGDYLPAEDYDSVEQLVDNETGLSALYTRHWSRAQGKWFCNLHMLYGYSTGVTTALKVFTTPTT